MANLRARIDDLVAGDDYDYTATVPGLPTGTTIIKAWLTVKTNDTDADPGVFQKDITTTLVATKGQITDNGVTDGIGVCAFYCQASDTVLLTPNYEYFFDVQIQLSTNRLYTPIKGRLVAERQITTATS